MVQYFSSQFPKGGDTIITQEVLEHICNDINSSTLDVPQLSLGTNLPHFSQLCCENSTTFDTKLPLQHFSDVFRSSASPTLTKVMEMQNNLN